MVPWNRLFAQKYGCLDFLSYWSMHSHSQLNIENRVWGKVIKNSVWKNLCIFEHYWAFLLFQFASKMLNDHRKVSVEFFGHFLCSCKRISFYDGSQLVIVNFQWLVTMLLNFKALVSFANFFKPLLKLHWTFLSNSLANVVSCLWCFMAHFKLKKICFLSDIISIVENKYKINSK